ncbi:intraflagellar transport protein 20 homolog [Neodiprion pinetum]|uniref:Intraflagellar transport protein 20 homolog n=1 Tax=Neodiprion lecontei TaxID=441921 RepID=A0A6J0CBX8_NEOLC|nr:intraflagellar transport protein 20 homolog [Neodiprion lecontei]XP_046427018.1 intraflagellar transport protein 20 homolog [Neodiprion fabricii]XP_046482297.1 intraflagellar transport protein 20 homolog [Neodiprion pinetum]XP_046620960.1 intraflagellar transport protein 20 homolog [Neodiprion virginianus]
MADSLGKYGLFIDDLSKIRVLEPEISNQTNKLKEECQNFVSKITEFQKSSDDFIQIVDNLANEVEKEKMRTIGARNLLRSVAKQRDAQRQQIQALIIEKSTELERLRVQYDSLKKIELEQLETIEQLTAN